VIDAQEVLSGAFAMPRISPSYPIGPYRYAARGFLTITCATDPDAIAALPETLAAMQAEARLQFLRMPDSTGFGDYALVIQSIPCRLPDGEAAGFVLGTYVNAATANPGGRELWGFPQKLARPALSVVRDTLLSELDFGPVPVARASMGFKHRAVPADRAMAAIAAPAVLLKIIPHVDGTPRICELVRCRLVDVRLLGAWSAPAALELMPHALAPLADLPVPELASATHFIADLTLGLGEAVHDCLSPT
jgi:acetoacetate decarboxylase